MLVDSSSTVHKVASVLRAPARTATPANPKAARLSPAAVLQALRTSNSIGSGRFLTLTRNNLSNSLTLSKSFQTEI